MGVILKGGKELVVWGGGKEGVKGRVDLGGGLIEMGERGEEGVGGEVKEERGMRVREGE